MQNNNYIDLFNVVRDIIRHEIRTYDVPFTDGDVDICNDSVDVCTSTIITSLTSSYKLTPLPIWQSVTALFTSDVSSHERSVKS
jgi:hypothetical protein